MAWLLIETPDGKCRRFQLGDVDSSFGRAKSNAVTLDDTKCSSFHCVVRRGKHGRFCIADSGSRNGTTVNGVPIDTQGHELCDGDIVTMGRTIMRFSAEEPSAAMETILNPVDAAAQLAESSAALDVKGVDIPQPVSSETDSGIPAASTEHIDSLPMNDSASDDGAAPLRYKSTRRETETEVLTSRALPTEVVPISAMMRGDLSPADLPRIDRHSGGLALAVVGTGLAASFVLGWLLGAIANHSKSALAVANNATNSTAEFPPDATWARETSLRMAALMVRLERLDHRLIDYEDKFAEQTTVIGDLKTAVHAIGSDQEFIAQDTEAQRRAIGELRLRCQEIIGRLETANEQANVAADVKAVRAELSVICNRLAESERWLEPTATGLGTTTQGRPSTTVFANQGVD